MLTIGIQVFNKTYDRSPVVFLSKSLVFCTKFFTIDFLKRYLILSYIFKDDLWFAYTIPGQKLLIFLKWEYYNEGSKVIVIQATKIFSRLFPDPSTSQLRSAAKSTELREL